MAAQPVKPPDTNKPLMAPTKHCQEMSQLTDDSDVKEPESEKPQCSHAPCDQTHPFKESLHCTFDTKQEQTSFFEKWKRVEQRVGRRIKQNVQELVNNAVLEELMDHYLRCDRPWSLQQDTAPGVQTGAKDHGHEDSAVDDLLCMLEHGFKRPFDSMPKKSTSCWTKSSPAETLNMLGIKHDPACDKQIPVVVVPGHDDQPASLNTILSTSSSFLMLGKPTNDLDITTLLSKKNTWFSAVRIREEFTEVLSTCYAFAAADSDQSTTVAMPMSMLGTMLQRSSSRRVQTMGTSGQQCSSNEGNSNSDALAAIGLGLVEARVKPVKQNPGTGKLDLPGVGPSLVKPCASQTLVSSPAKDNGGNDYGYNPYRVTKLQEAPGRTKNPDPFSLPLDSDTDTSDGSGMMCDDKDNIVDNSRRRADDDNEEDDEVLDPRFRYVRIRPRSPKIRKPTKPRDTSCLCFQCGKLYSTRNHLVTHIHNVHSGREFVCEDCGHTTHTKALLSMHRRTVHIRLRQFQCMECDYKSECAGPLKVHIDTVHKKIRKHACSYCDKAFKKPAARKTHELIHTGEKPVKCRLCDFACRQTASLSWHMKTKHA